MDPEIIGIIVKLIASIVEQFIKGSEAKKAKIKDLLREVDHAFESGDTSQITSLFDSISNL